MTIDPEIADIAKQLIVTGGGIVCAFIAATSAQRKPRRRKRPKPKAKPEDTRRASV